MTKEYRLPPTRRHASAQWSSLLAFFVIAAVVLSLRHFAVIRDPYASYVFVGALLVFASVDELARRTSVTLSASSFVVRDDAFGPAFNFEYRDVERVEILQVDRVAWRLRVITRVGTAWNSKVWYTPWRPSRLSGRLAEIAAEISRAIAAA